MNVEPENSPSTPGNDPLDQLLTEASWPTARPNRESLFAERWREVWLAQRRRERLAFKSAVAGIAATLLVAATLGWGWLNRHETRLAHPFAIEQRPSPPDRGKGAPIVKETQMPRTALRPVSPSQSATTLVHAQTSRVLRMDVADEPVLSRPPNKLEAMLLAALVRGGADRKNRQARSTVPPGKAAVAVDERDSARAAVLHLVADSTADPAQVAAALRSTSPVNERRLVAILADSPPAEQIAAVRLLGEIGSSQAVPELLLAAAQANLHRWAINALSRIADSATINQLVREEPNKDLQGALLAALLSRGDAEALSDYLGYIAGESTSETALAAAETVPNPPLEMLFSALRSSSELDRLAAARVLGRIDGPTTTERLIAMVEEGPSRQEACVALLSSHGPEALNFVKNARTSPALSALLQAAGVLVSNNTQPRS